MARTPMVLPLGPVPGREQVWRMEKEMLEEESMEPQEEPDLASWRLALEQPIRTGRHPMNSALGREVLLPVAPPRQAGSMSGTGQV
jgi:hypothetical protein